MFQKLTLRVQKIRLVASKMSKKLSVIQLTKYCIQNPGYITFCEKRGILSYEDAKLMKELIKEIKENRKIDAGLKNKVSSK
jgi:hypothetical protein